MARTADVVKRWTSGEEMPDLLALSSSPATWAACAPEARAPLFAAAYLRDPKKTLVVTPNYDRALAWQAKLVICGVPQDRIRHLPSGSSTLFDDSPPEHVALSDRLGALRALVEDEPVIVLATAQSALERTLPPDQLRDSDLEFRFGP